MMALSHFDEKGGIAPCSTEWGRWWQTVGEVCIEVNLESGTKAKEINVTISRRKIECNVRGKTIFSGLLKGLVVCDETVWTVEDNLLCIQLTKTGSANTEDYWESLLEGEYAPDAFTLLEMRKKLDLEKFQIENPGFDFSGAQLSKCYDN